MSFSFRFKSDGSSQPLKASFKSVDSVESIKTLAKHDEPQKGKNDSKKNKSKCDKCGCSCGGGGTTVTTQNLMMPGPDSWLTTNSTADPFNVDFYLIDAALASITLSFPDASVADGQSVYVKRIDTSLNTVTLDTVVGGQTIDGSSTISISVGDPGRLVVSGNGNWW